MPSGKATSLTVYVLANMKSEEVPSCFCGASGARGIGDPAAKQSGECQTKHRGKRTRGTLCTCKPCVLLESHGQVLIHNAEDIDGTVTQEDGTGLEGCAKDQGHWRWQWLTRGELQLVNKSFVNK